MMAWLDNKVPPLAVVVIIALLMWAISRGAPTMEANSSALSFASIAALVLGVFFSVAGVVSFRLAKTTVDPLKPETAAALVCTGIYRVSRNPMYVGFVLLLLAWVLYLASPWTLLGVVGFILYMNRFQIAPEERALSKKFPLEFEAYKSKVRRWL